MEPVVVGGQKFFLRSLTSEVIFWTTFHPILMQGRFLHLNDGDPQCNFLDLIDQFYKKIHFFFRPWEGF